VRHPILIAVAAALSITSASSARAATSHAQLCESAIDGANAKYAACRLTAQAVNVKKPAATKLAAALAKCQANLQKAFTKTLDKYGASCAVVETEPAFDSYTSRCSSDLSGAAAGGSLPDYVGELATCNADLTTAQDDLATCEADLTTCESAAKTIKTGVTTCSDVNGNAIPCAGTGQDGELQEGVARSYVDNGDGTITDLDTNLMWEKLSDDGSVHDRDNTYTWTDAVAVKVAALNAGGGFAGHTDWRFPNASEIESLTDFGHTYPAVSPAFNTGCVPGCTVTTCSCTGLDRYWTSTTFALSPQDAWLDSSGDGGRSLGAKVNPYFVRAVRTAS